MYLSVYCETLVEDFKAAQQLILSGYGRQILTVRYEDVVKDSVAAVKQLYQ